MGGTSIFVSAARAALKKWMFELRALEAPGTFESRGKAFAYNTR